MKAKLPRVERKVIVQERFTSPWNIAVLIFKGYHRYQANVYYCVATTLTDTANAEVLLTQKFELAPPGELPSRRRPRRSYLVSRKSQPRR